MEREFHPRLLAFLLLLMIPLTCQKVRAMRIDWLEWRLGDSLGISVTGETLERAARV